MSTRVHVTWKDALRALAIDARRRAANSQSMKSGPSDEVSLARLSGAAYAFNAMAVELEYLAMHCSSAVALEKIRKLLDGPRPTSKRRCDVCPRTTPHVHCPECGSIEHVAEDCDMEG